MAVLTPLHRSLSLFVIIGMLIVLAQERSKQELVFRRKNSLPLSSEKSSKLRKVDERERSRRRPSPVR
jgi:hypothetical protein